MSSAGRPVLVADVLGTLVRDPFFHGMAGHFGFDSFKAFLSAKAPDVWPLFERGALTEAELGAGFFRADGDRDAAIDVPALKDFMARSYELLPGIDALLRATTAAGVDVHLCTNYPQWTHLIEAAVGLHAEFGAQWTFVSAREGVRKPDAGAYALVAQRAGVAVGDCVLLDDREENCTGAVDAGFLAAVQFGSAEQAARELADIFAARSVTLDVSGVQSAVAE